MIITHITDIGRVLIYQMVINGNGVHQGGAPNRNWVGAHLRCSRSDDVRCAMSVGAHHEIRLVARKTNVRQKIIHLAFIQLSNLCIMIVYGTRTRHKHTNSKLIMFWFVVPLSYVRCAPCPLLRRSNTTGRKRRPRCAVRMWEVKETRERMKSASHTMSAQMLEHITSTHRCAIDLWNILNGCECSNRWHTKQQYIQCSSAHAKITRKSTRSRTNNEA